ncbi:MAG: SMC family ATPase, partial [Microbacteriaceae bacterium]|nr:SMC family ATPase [Microbacteriaceae bacterium]
MRMRRLELAGFGPFRERQTVDFADFEDEGLFLIGGRTGAGKSSVLDAIAYALYGRAPRYGGVANPEVRSAFCADDELTEVVLEFEHGGAEYRVRRTHDRRVAKKSGPGTRTVRGGEELAVRETGADGAPVWRALATQRRDIGRRLHEIFPLSADEFLQVVLLAQNEFQRFLRAASAERQRVLRKLFRTARFAELGDLVQERAKRSAAELDAAQERVERALAELERLLAELVPPVDGAADDDAHAAPDDSAADAEGAVDDVGVPPAERIDGLVARIDAVLAERSAALETARTDAGTAAAALASAERTAERQDRRDRAAAELAALDAAADALRREVLDVLERGRRAAPLVPRFEAETAAVAALDEAERALIGARDRLGALEAGAVATDAAADGTAAGDPGAAVLDARLAEWRDLRGTLRAAGDLDARLAEARAARAEAERALAELAQGETAGANAASAALEPLREAAAR